jgi:hypothetical protein
LWRNACRVLVGKRLRGRSRQRWRDDIKMYLKETGWKGIGWIKLANDTDKWQAAVAMTTNIQVSQNAGNFVTSSGTSTFSSTSAFGFIIQFNLLCTYSTASNYSCN